MHRALAFFFLMLSTICYSAVPKGNSAWVYDTLYDDTGNRIGMTPGLFANDLFKYNQLATAPHKLNVIFTYGGFIKMFCQGSGGTTPTTPCTPDTIQVNYAAESTAAYNNVLNSPTRTISLMPIVDGVIGGEFLKNFNTLDQPTANKLADKIASIYCADDLVDGVQFNLERFDITQPGQINFYRRIARNFAGQNKVNNVDIFGCVNANHPTGRIFSVFTTSRNFTATLAGILNLYRNGYAIGALYSLGPAIEQATPPIDYYTLVRNEVKRVVTNASQNNIKYVFGIPASSTNQEFESIAGVASGYAQLSYVVAALDAINQYARTDKNYLGISLWAYSSRRFKNEKEFLPSIPTTLVQSYLQGFLLKVGFTFNSRINEEDKR